ncbi:MAG: endonuclease/exonuclease/phosphatase family protein [Bacteroidales bacterium]|nr:endonuclease/exonuclease/phosphatase family protein [Bacteroidales bacterium]MBN2749688.1 endonuclease/exonuclease/phosphatase family protein [Bacteroidales bacterium]
MRALRKIATILVAAILFLAIFIAYSTLTEFKPEPTKTAYSSNSPDTIYLEKELSLTTWNVGYGGLGANMDFFYDDGKKTRDTKENTLANLDSIKSWLTKHKSTNFFLLQEVDFGSQRSYNIEQLGHIADNLGSHNKVTAYNYLVGFVPAPISSPMGHVSSGLALLSHPNPKLATRISYPGSYPWPKKLFMLRRCMLANRYPVSNGKELIVINTHKSAFDDGSLKQQEMEKMKAFIEDEFSKGNYIIVGGDWNQAPPSFPLNTFGNNYEANFFKLMNIPTDFMPQGWQWVYDSQTPTNRYLNEPYQKGNTFTSILDFFLVSPNIEVLSCSTANLDFRYSDHNPVSVSVKLKE